MRHLWLTTALCGIVLVSAAQAAPGDKAVAEMKDRDGKTVGRITLTETPVGVLLSGEVGQLTPGAHGFHLHAVGKCEPPFTTAGGHFNPGGKKHGFHTGEGPHAGDLPNLHASADGKAVVDVLAPGVTVASGSASLFDQDGTALVIHEKADDYKTDPAGDSGSRVACGLVQQGS